jgi:hypothetical protein
MQLHGITLSFHREMADSSRELVGPDVSAAVSFESYPRFIKGGFQDYEGLGIKRFTADSKHVPSVRAERPVSCHELLKCMRGCAARRANRDGVLKMNQKADAAASAVPKINNR